MCLLILFISRKHGKIEYTFFPRYCGSCSAERGVATVLRSAAVKKVVPILSTSVKKVFLRLAAILNLRNAFYIY
jgi:hypothetical protein